MNFLHSYCLCRKLAISSSKKKTRFSLSVQKHYVKHSYTKSCIFHNYCTSQYWKEVLQMRRQTSSVVTNSPNSIRNYIIVKNISTTTVPLVWNSGRRYSITSDNGAYILDSFGSIQRRRCLFGLRLRVDGSVGISTSGFSRQRCLLLDFLTAAWDFLFTKSSGYHRQRCI